MEYWGEKFKELCKVLEDSIVFCFSVNGIKDDGKYWAILFFVVIARDCTILWGLADKKKMLREWPIQDTANEIDEFFVLYF